MAKYNVDLIFELSDGIMKSREIAEIVGCPIKYVQKIWLKNPHLKRPKQAPPVGKCNPAYKTGRSIQKDGYALVCIPPGHPYGRYWKGPEKYGRIYEHRKVMEEYIGRYLLPSEVVDHIDGCSLHNDIKNLRLFDSNKDHLKKTLAGKTPDWSQRGQENFVGKIARPPHPRIDTYHHRRKSGAIRVLQILRAHELLDKESPFLLGTAPYLEKAKVDLGDFLKSKLVAKEYLLQRHRHLWCAE